MHGPEPFEERQAHRGSTVTSQSDWIPQSSTWTDDELVRSAPPKSSRSRQGARMAASGDSSRSGPYGTATTSTSALPTARRMDGSSELSRPGRDAFAPAAWSVTSPSSDLTRPSTPESTRPITANTTGTVRASLAPWSVPWQLAQRCGSPRAEPQPRMTPGAAARTMLSRGRGEPGEAPTKGDQASYGAARSRGFRGTPEGHATARNDRSTSGR
jgi:hypothetical protein